MTVDHRNERSRRGCSDHAAPVVAAWAAHDAEHALHPADREVIRATEAARWLVVELFGATTSARDLFNACARLGGLTAENGGSPSLAAVAIDGVVHALSVARVPFDGGRVAAARASLIEGYVAAVRDAQRSSAAARWEYPACAVPLRDGSVAIACGYPEEDGEALAGWAGRVAKHLVKTKIRRVRLAGPDAAKAEVSSALALVGIAVEGLEAEPPAPTRAEPTGWFRLPWRK